MHSRSPEAAAGRFCVLYEIIHHAKLFRDFENVACVHIDFTRDCMAVQ